MRLRLWLAVAGFAACFLASAQTLARNAYITNFDANTVSVIDTATNTVTATIPVGASPEGVGVTPDGSTVYVANADANTVSVIDTATNTVTATIPVGTEPFGVAVTPDGSTVYVANGGLFGEAGTVSVIDTTTNTVTATIPVGAGAAGVAVTPVQRKREAKRERDGSGGREREREGTTVYVTNGFSNTVSVIDTATNTVTATIPGFAPFGVAVTPVQRKREAERERDGSGGREREREGSTAYVTNFNANTVSVIDTATNTVTATIPVGAGPTALGLFIQPALRFAGTPGKANCYGESVLALVRHYKSLNVAAAALGFPSVRALQNAILAFCEGE